MTTTNKNEIINAFLNGAIVIDNHDNSVIKLEAIIEFNSENRELAGLVDASYQCLNAVYLHDDGTLHLSQYSIGGTLYGYDFDRYNNSVIYETMEIKRVIWTDGNETYPSLILKPHSDNEYPEEQPEEKQEENKIASLKSELEDLLNDEPEVDKRIRDLHKTVVNIRSAVKEDSKTYKIADKLAAMCREETVNFDSDILPLLNKAVSVMDLDLQNNDILRNPNITIAYDIKNIEIEFL